MYVVRTALEPRKYLGWKWWVRARVLAYQFMHRADAVQYAMIMRHKLEPHYQGRVIIDRID